VIAPFFDRRILTHFDFLLMFLVIPLVLTSWLLVSEISTMLANKQLVYIGIGIGLFFFIFFLPLRKFTWLIPTFYWLGILLLLAVEFIGITKLGAQRWLQLPLINLTIQPSELMKPAFILMLGYLINNNPPPRDGYGIKDFAKLSFFILLPFFLIAKEPDLGTATIVLIVGGAVLLAVGVERRIWISLIILFGLSSTLLYDNLHDYQKKRITDFLAEKPSYHVQQSIIAIGSGGLTGQEKEEATQTQLKFLPIASSDFIFAYVVERFGFIGAFLLISLYAAIILHLLTLTNKVKKDYLASVTILSLSVLFFIYMSVNIAMTIGLAPVVGVPLPMFSHGGSSFITFMILLAIVQHFLAFRFNLMYTFDSKFSD
jgi:rod shape determining protein RodA